MEPERAIASTRLTALCLEAELCRVLPINVIATRLKEYKSGAQFIPSETIEQ